MLANEDGPARYGHLHSLAMWFESWPCSQTPEWVKFLKQFTNLFLILLEIAAILGFIAYGLNRSVSECVHAFFLCRDGCSRPQCTLSRSQPHCASCL